MQIPDERLRQFQTAYQLDFGEEITLEEAREMLSRLVSLYDLLLRPIPNSAPNESVTERESFPEQVLATSNMNTDVFPSTPPP